MLTLRNKIKNLDVNVMLKTHEWVRKKKAIQTWFGGWTLKKVVMHHQKKSINKVLEEAGIKQGSTEMIKSYQKAIDTIMKSLTAEEIQEAEALAIEWNEHDFNNELGNGKLFEDLDECQDKFVKYTQMAFGNGSTDAESPDKDAAPWSWLRKSNGKPKTILPVSDNSMPYIPNILDMWMFVTFHYSILEWWQEQKERHPNNIFSFKKWRDAGGSLQMLVAAADSSGVRMGATQDFDGTPDHLEGERMMDRMMQGMKECIQNLNVWQYYLMGNKVVGSDSDNESNRQQIPTTLPSNGNDGTCTSMVYEDATEAVALPDSQQRIAGCQVAEGNTCRPFAIGKEQPNAWWQVVGSTSSTVQPMTEGRCTDSPDSLQPAEPLAVPTTIKRAHKQEDSNVSYPYACLILLFMKTIARLTNETNPLFNFMLYISITSDVVAICVQLSLSSYRYLCEVMSPELHIRPF
ncbi:hypothetical protein BKA82DRAFT_4022134 [Pisolithus tinctorius]|nr:hypothetical protein BKA82DRAFT_4022134 [Pisolithus tinctorius]